MLWLSFEYDLADAYVTTSEYNSFRYDANSSSRVGSAFTKALALSIIWSTSILVLALSNSFLASFIYDVINACFSVL